MRYVIGALAVVACVLPVWASEPGEPLDCSEWVFLEPALNCVPVVPHPCVEDTVPWPYGSAPTRCLASRDTRTFDNEGRLLRVQQVRRPDMTLCNGFEMQRLELQRVVGPIVNVLAYVEDRCVDPGTGRVDQLQPFPDDNVGTGSDHISIDRGSTSVVNFDPINGHLLVTVRNECIGPACPAGYEGPWLLRIASFTTLYEVMQSYAPTGPLAFRVPAMPEGFQDADSFDTYTGPLTNPIDFSKAQPLQCDYPATAPSMGDYLTVADPLPDPAPGAGRYYVTAVTHQGQTRYGRKNLGGLSGRDPGVLAGCDQ